MALHRHIPPETRFWVQVSIPDDKSQCWPWTGTLNQGYGQVRWRGRVRRAHLVAYELLRGSIPERKLGDHLCHTQSRNCPGGHNCPHRRCVNPWHIEFVVHAENVRRGLGPSANNARKTCCPKGHPYSGRNSQGGRVCAICLRAASARRQAKIRAGASVNPKKRTHCKNGHRLSGGNLKITPLGHHVCRACRNETKLAYYYRTKGAQ